VVRTQTLDVQRDGARIGCKMMKGFINKPNVLLEKEKQNYQWKVARTKQKKA